MNLIKIKAVYGPNIFHSRPVMISKLDLGEHANISSADIPGFPDRLVEMLPGLFEHTCSLGYYGGFYERLIRGTYMAHIIEHVALEFSELAGIGVTYGKSVYAGEVGMRQIHALAFALVEATVRSRDFNFQTRLLEIKEIIEETKLGPSTQAIFQAAQSRGIFCQRVGNQSLLRLGFGKNTRYVQAALTDRTSNIAVELVQDKAKTKNLLQDAGIPVPQGFVISKHELLDEALESIGFPVAIKPHDGNHGNGVSLNIKNHEEAMLAFHLAKKFSSEVLVEGMCFGQDFRVLVVDGKMCAAAERVPPSVVGDGISSVLALIERLNSDPRRCSGHSGVLTKIETDELLLQTLKRNNVSFSTVLPNDHVLFLRENANLSGGATAKDVTDLVHPSIRICCERISRLVGLDICGVDLIHKDMRLPLEEGMQVIEVNAGPGLRMHLAPSEGKPRPVGQKIVDMLYANAEQSRIPIIGVTGTNGKTSVVRMLAKVFTQQGFNVGMTSSDGVWIGSEQIDSGDTSGPLSASKILTDTKVDFAVLELARGGLMRGGLAYDYSDVGVVTNIRADHIGQDGIEDIEDLVRVKSLVAERVREGGTIVLNADDKMSLGLRTHRSVTYLERKVMLYSANQNNPEIRAHMADGQDACFLEKENIVIWHQQKKYL